MTSMSPSAPVHHSGVSKTDEANSSVSEIVKNVSNYSYNGSFRNYYAQATAKAVTLFPKGSFSYLLILDCL